jgi:hypothetical protein
MRTTDYAANALRTAAASICSAAGVNRETLTRPMRLKVKRATGSQKSVETPSASIAITRCSSASRSVHEIPSIVRRLGSLTQANDRPRQVKVLLNSFQSFSAALVSKKGRWERPQNANSSGKLKLRWAGPPLDARQAATPDRANDRRNVRRHRSFRATETTVAFGP